MFIVIIKMVYKLRNKTFNNFAPATSPRAYVPKRTRTHCDLTQQVMFSVHITRFTGMRILHNYRNISRATKQFLMGDRFLEQLMICQIRENFFRPMYYKAPIENTFFIVSAPL